MVQTNAVAANMIHHGIHLVIHPQRTLSQFADMTDSLTIFLGISDRETGRRRCQFALIANLTAGFAVERGFAQDHDRIVARLNFRHRLALTINRHDLRLLFGTFVAAERRRLIHTDQAVVIGAEAAGVTRTLALCFHRTFETRFIHFQITLTANIRGQIDREAISVIETERRFAAQGIALKLFDFVIQQQQPTLQRTGKLFFFILKRLLHQTLLAFKLFGSRPHHLNQSANQLIEEGFFRTQHVTVANSTTNDATQHITAVFIRRHYAIGNQERTGADVIGDDAQRLIIQIIGSHHAGGFRDQCLEQIDLVVGIHMLQDGGNTFQPHTGINRWFRQRQHSAISLSVELHEYQVPDLDVAVAIFFRASRRSAPDVIAMIVENFRARAARTSIAHLPEVI